MIQKRSTEAINSGRSDMRIGNLVVVNGATYIQWSTQMTQAMDLLYLAIYIHKTFWLITAAYLAISMANENEYCTAMHTPIKVP